MRDRPGSGEGLGGRVRAREPDHLVAVLDQLSDDRGTDEPGRTGNENTHDLDLRRTRPLRVM